MVTQGKVCDVLRGKTVGSLSQECVTLGGKSDNKQTFILKCTKELKITLFA